MKTMSLIKKEPDSNQKIWGGTYMLKKAKHCTGTEYNIV